MSIDFTSSLYLDMYHGSHELKPWSQLTTGVPSALRESKAAQMVANKIAELQGFQKGIAVPSTLHAYWDMSGLLAQSNVSVFTDQYIYPVSGYGKERLLVNRTPSYRYRHHESSHLQRQLTDKIKPGTRPVILTDGWCPVCGKSAPIADYVDIARPLGGLVIIDDTQSFGILGSRQNGSIYGEGGGGILNWLGIGGRQNIVTITSLAKGFGVPITIIAASPRFIEKYTDNSTTRSSSSPVSMAHVHATQHALSLNEKYGEQRRAKLLENIVYFKKAMKAAGTFVHPSIFPVQLVSFENARHTLGFYQKMRQANIQTVLVKRHADDQPVIAFILRSNHTLNDLKTLAANSRSAYQSIFKMQYYEHNIR